MWRVWLSPDSINSGDFRIPPTMNMGGIHHIPWKGIPNHRIIDSYRLHTCREHFQHAGRIVWALDSALKMRPVTSSTSRSESPLISIFPCNQLLSGFIWIIPLDSIYIFGLIQLFTPWVRLFLECQQCRVQLMLHLRDKKDHLTNWV